MKGLDNLEYLPWIYVMLCVIACSNIVMCGLSNGS
jgi:hypothetical protein